MAQRGLCVCGQERELLPRPALRASVCEVSALRGPGVRRTLKNRRLVCPRMWMCMKSWLAAARLYGAGERAGPQRIRGRART